MYNFVQRCCLGIESSKWLCGSGATPNTGWKTDMNMMGNNMLGRRYGLDNVLAQILNSRFLGTGDVRASLQ
jgi:hypothetical protein